MSRLLAFLLLIFISPLLFAISIIQLLVFGNIIFAQLRIGKDNRPFSLYKFQTMLPKAQQMIISAWGGFLRKTSLDELPQLWNILWGDMNFVGPRPLLPEYLTLYSEEQKKRHLVKPGLTGWAQVNGRNNLSWKEQFELDVWYVENRSAWLDIKILWRTLLQCFKPRAGSLALRPPFNGDN